MQIPGAGIAKGMATTLRNFFAPKVTRQYPEVRREADSWITYINNELQVLRQLLLDGDGRDKVYLAGRIRPTDNKIVDHAIEHRSPQAFQELDRRVRLLAVMPHAVLLVLDDDDGLVLDQRIPRAFQHVELEAAQPANVERHLQQARRTYRRVHGHSPDYRSWRYIHTSGIHMLLRLVQGQWPPESRAVTPVEILQRVMCEEYARWMTGSRGLARQTASDCCAEARRFLNWLGERTVQEGLATLTLLDVDAYMKDRAASLSRRSLNSLATRMRSFLRWLHMTEHTIRDLSSTVITPPLYAFEGIPSALREEDVKKALADTRQDCTPKGIRDYAILMLLSVYGVRAGEIAALRLEDVDWRKDVIRIRHSKTGAISYLPLLPEVGEAIFKYLQKSPPPHTASTVQSHSTCAVAQSRPPKTLRPHTLAPTARKRTMNRGPAR